MNRISELISLTVLVLAVLGYGKEPAHHTTDSQGVVAATPVAAAVKPMMSPDHAYALLMDGNARYTTGRSLHLRQGEEQRIKAATEGQTPFVSILTCSDSRVPPEIIFDAGIGELFVARVAGNVADKTEIGTLEYGTGKLGTPLIVVMGHTKCETVSAVVKKSEVGGNIQSLAHDIEPAVQKTRDENHGIDEDAMIEKSIRNNIFQSIEDIFKSSPEIRTLVKDGKVRVIGALYDIETGKVSDLGVHLRQDALLRAAQPQK